ncbi:Gfo/Idh/MocA family protein [Levilinea saccharolytica]|uniref:Oxidoreductase n=1 Tax=Levilinea saccharolytica TaxID=229921 RepID=A0A0P6Y4S6_9CHLR|nr:Gfo/Idh/MocA family oxidoreductase [Levilinea saccharolytica]KPL86883.1 oxidoreductase [Levilinea saccharolytica]GAP17795.1 predicted dehydrogenase [Levilinea saccharolytica]
MPPSPIRIGIIGIGQIGRHHLKTYRTIPGVEVVAVAGRDPQRTAQAAQETGVAWWTTDYHQLLAREDIDAVSICLHNHLHRPAAEAALRAGKHVYCEKPIAGTYADGLAMLAAAQAAGKHLAVQLSTLFSPEIKAARHAVDQGWLGHPYYAASTGFRRQGRPYVDGYGTPAFVQKSQAAGGALLDMGVYHIAALLYLLGNPAPLRISGITAQETEMDAARQRVSGYDVEEFASGFVRLQGGLTLHIIEAWAAHLDTFGGSYILGSRGGLRLEPFGLFQSFGDLSLSSAADLDAFAYRQHTVRQQGTAYDGPQQHFIAALRGEVPPLPTAEIALNTQRISDGIYLSQQLGREITVEEIPA